VRQGPYRRAVKRSWPGRPRSPVRAAVVAVLVAAVAIPTGHAGSRSVFVVSGGGYGHGVGMSQWGAFGQARAGRDYRQILAHYYRGTTLGRTTGRPVRVLVADGLPRVTIGSDAPFVVTGPGDASVEHPAGDAVITPDLSLGVGAARSQDAGELTVRPSPGALLRLGGTTYRGTLRISATRGALRVVNDVGLEQYLRSVVASEMPSTWLAAALQAQAVAARTYAVAKLAGQAPFDLYADTRSQVYGGASVETPAASSAVAATALQVLLYADKPATTFYFASSGGRTARAVDVFGLDFPYLVSVPDPWDRISPNHEWKPVRLSAAGLRRLLRLPGSVADVVTRRGPSGYPITVDVTTRGGDTVAVPAPELRTALGLRSTRFRIGQLSLSPLPEAVTFGARAIIAGVARDITRPLLEARAPGESWETVARLRSARDGTFVVRVRPASTVEYRLVGGGVVGPRITVDVAPRVRLRATAGVSALSGTVSPKLGGATVVIERRHGAAWRRITATGVSPAGAFRARLAVRAASYRARVLASSGFAAGESPVVVVR
jgi:stage II sporulation protein D